MIGPDAVDLQIPPRQTLVNEADAFQQAARGLVVGQAGGLDAVQRQFRWARLRRVTFLPFFALEILAAPLLPAVLAIGGAASLGLPVWLAPLLVLAIWYAGDIVLSAAAGWFVNWRSPLAMLIRDIAFPGIWAYAFIGGEVSWRGNAMTIRTDGTNELNQAAPALSAARAKISD